MHLSQARAELESLIRQSGVEQQHPDPRLLWEAFRGFIQIPFASPFAATLFDAEVSASPVQDVYYIELSKQFSNCDFGTLGEATPRPFHYYKLGIKLAYEPDEELIRIIERRTSAPSEQVQEFLSRIEALPIFKAAFHLRRPTAYKLVTFGEPFVVPQT